MTPPAASPHLARRTPWALWTALLAMLLALQASAGATRPAALAESGAVAAKLTLPAPLAAQLREPGHVLKASAQRPSVAKPQNGHDGAPPLPAQAAALSAPLARAHIHFARPADAVPGESTTRAYRARAPPHRA